MIHLITRQTSEFNYLDDINYISLEEGIELLGTLGDRLGLDTETTGLDFLEDIILLVQIGNPEHQVLFDIGSFDGKIPKKLKKFIKEYKGTWILQNAKFDIKFLFVQGIILTKIFDTFLAETILTNGLQYAGRGLKDLAEKYCRVELDKGVRLNINKASYLTESVLIYSAKDVEFLEVIMDKQVKTAIHLDVMNAVNLDNSFVVVLAYIEFCGIKLDWGAWSEIVEKNIKKAEILKSELEAMVLADGHIKYFSGMVCMFTGTRDCLINWNSPKQVMEIFNLYGIKTYKRERGEKKNSIDAKVLEPQSNDFVILPIYLKFKALQKSISTYGYNWKSYISPKTGRIHSIFKQLMDTGRLSCGSKRDNRPNLQNIPSDAASRACFVSEKDHLITAADYSSKLKKYHMYSCVA